jgi:hypothetical protein
MTPATRRVAILGILTALLLAAALALPLAADPHPNVAIGLSPDKSYQIGDVDNVNLFNGALTVTLPLGPSYPLGGNLSYQLTLVRNSNPWFVLQTTDSTGTIYNESLPSTCSNAGLGWRLSFGELDPYCSPSDFSNHIYQDPSGADHVFYPTLHAGETAVAGVFYTRDGTYLRLKWSDPTAELDFPDGGTVRSFPKTAVVDPAPIRDLRVRGMSAPRLVTADGHLGIWTALAEVFPAAREQRCWNHKLVNVLDALPKKKQAEARELLRRIPYAPMRCEAESLRAEFRSLYGAEHPKAAETLERDWERMVAFYGFPKEHWKHLRTTNPVESPFAAVRLRTAAGKRYKKVANATALIWRVLRVAERSFRRLDHRELLPELAEGAIYEDGVRVVRVNPATEEVAA